MRRLALFPELYSWFGKAAQFGLLRRNLAQYEKFIARGDFDEIYIFSYDDRDHGLLADLKRDSGLPNGFQVLTPPRLLHSKLGAILYSVIGPVLHRKVLSQVDVLRTQQVSGSWSALITKLLYGKPLLFRVGYPLSIRFKDEGAPIRHAIARVAEWLIVRCSDHVAVTSRAMQQLYAGMAGGRTEVTVLPSYADGADFKPIAHYDRTRPILFVGRLDPVKKIDNLIRACARLEQPLHIYGIGPLEQELKDLAQALGADVAFKGVVPNRELMRVHHSHTIYVLCSVKEGMPKALIEALASGLICVGTRTEGIAELIEDGVTGYLIDGTEADAIEQRLRYVLDSLDPEVGRRASAYARRYHSLEHAVELELAILEKIGAPHRQAAAKRVMQH